jgi:polysaccharide transporter, PST family
MILYAVQGCNYLLPLITFPYLSRVLHPAGLGAVVFAQTIGVIISVAVEYGFDFSGTREVARFSEDQARLQSIVAGILGAKVMLAGAAILAAFVIRPFTLHIAPSPALFWASTVWGVAQGINMLWYFQGLQRMAWSGGLDVAGKVIATLSIFVFVHSPEDGWKVMAAQAVGGTVAHAISFFMAHREIGFRWPTRQMVWDALRFGWPIFLFKASQLLMSSANSLTLGFLGTLQAVGLFGGVDKIRTVASQSLWPVSQALFPHQSNRVTEDVEAGARTVRRSLLLIGGLSAVFGVVLAAGAPLIVRLVLGAAYLPAVPALRIFGLIVPLITCAGILCFQWMLPLGFDREFNFVVFTAGLVNVAGGLALAPKFGVTGMAIAVTLSEVYALIGFDTALRRKGLSPLGRYGGSGKNSRLVLAIGTDEGR